jgi:hypothetical protein
VCHALVWLRPPEFAGFVTGDSALTPLLMAYPFCAEPATFPTSPGAALSWMRSVCARSFVAEAVAMAVTPPVLPVPVAATLPSWPPMPSPNDGEYRLLADVVASMDGPSARAIVLVRAAVGAV